ncbi:MAG: excinuclease ABC subunit C [Flavobacteriales bacterium]|nr:excinuclease ABC subunit C [Flavobacteriales bacterium]
MELEDKISTLPNRPGIYQFKNADGDIIYVGKAKKLRNRVRSYFNKDKAKNGKTRMLVRHIEDLEYMEVSSEQDAFLLENNLIKRYKPKYNIQLKDDKTFPWLCIKKEPFPRIFSTRNKVDDGSEYFGPYASVKLIKTLLSLATKLYPLRTCNYNLTQKNIEAGKFKVCLEYHIGNCLGPCEGFQTEEDYMQGIQTIRQIIKGNTREVIASLEERMAQYAAELDFERAQLLKEKLDMVQKYQSGSAVVSSHVQDAEVYYLRKEMKKYYVGFVKVIDGAIVQGHVQEMSSGIADDESEILTYAIRNIREETGSSSVEIISPVELPELDEEVQVTVPQRGERKQLLDLCERNVKYYLLEKRKQSRLVDPEQHYSRILTQVKEDLRLNELPVHIECFDNSNIQGTHPTSACVVFKNGKPSKKDYRHFNIKTVEGPDDFASMREVIHRRYSRLLKDGESLPQLVIIDGGKGQLSSAMRSVDELGIRGKMTVIGIAKRLEEIYYPGDSIPVYIDKKSESLKLIQHLRNEAHRFSLAHHRNRRSKSAIGTELTEIQGIGKGTAQNLLKHFGSVKNIREANEEQLTQVVGANKAKIIFQYFQVQ